MPIPHDFESQYVAIKKSGDDANEPNLMRAMKRAQTLCNLSIYQRGIYMVVLYGSQR